MEDIYLPPTSKLPQISSTGEYLSDQNLKGKERPWRMNKQTSELLAEASTYLGEEKRAERVGKCASHLLFLECLQDLSLIHI